MLAHISRSAIHIKYVNRSTRSVLCACKYSTSSASRWSLQQWRSCIFPSSANHPKTIARQYMTAQEVLESSKEREPFETIDLKVDTIETTSPQPPKAKRGRKPKSNTESLSDTTDLDAIPPLAISTKHTTLAEFLRHVHRKDLSRSSSVYFGTLYEYIVLEHLQNTLGFELTRVGGRGDSGIDLIGTWKLPTTNPYSKQRGLSPVTAKTATSADTNTGTILRTIIQCKRITSHRTRSKSSTTIIDPDSNANSSTPQPQPPARRPTSILPQHIRELQGTLLHSSPPGWRDPTNTLGILICTRPASEGVRKAMTASRRGLIVMCIEEIPEAEVLYTDNSTDTTSLGRVVKIDDTEADVVVPRTRLVQMLWNSAAGKMGLDSFDVVPVYSGHAVMEGVELVR